ncbi:aspartate racemase [Babesia caballi]|uniref:Aspartate racemase n=1 Tax=Babesia caballi TaxID=5871 RepID=A0AAV4LX61_BABCB|nr:aspartate racemase [Babesia caballi]
MMASGRAVCGCTAFNRAVHLGLASVNAYLELRHSTANVSNLSKSARCLVVSGYAPCLVAKRSVGSARSSKPKGRQRSEPPVEDTAKPSKTYEKGAERDVLRGDSSSGRSCVDSIFGLKCPGVTGTKSENTPQQTRDGSVYRGSIAVEAEEQANYYDIRDPRDAVESPGFSEGDPRARLTSRQHATEDIELGWDDERAANTIGRHAIAATTVETVKLKKLCLVTKKWIEVEKSINSLGGTDIIEAICFNMPQYSQLKTVESMYRSFNGNDAKTGNPVVVGAEVLKLLEKQVCLLARSRALMVREAVMILMIYDRERQLAPEMRDLLAVALQSQLYAFRPYDIAATVAVYGKYSKRYRPLLNTLGLVFYDHMIAGSTAVAPDGPRVAEVLAVLEAYGKARMPIKRMTDAAFGTLYEHFDELSSTQKLTAFETFFELSKDKNFVELFTKILASLLGEPHLFIDSFQRQAEIQLKSDFMCPVAESSSYSFREQDPFGPSEVMRILSSMANCTSEHLTNSVHARIEFKRLWRDNIRKQIMPWKGPTIASYPTLAPRSGYVTNTTSAPALTDPENVNGRDEKLYPEDIPTENGSFSVDSDQGGYTSLAHNEDVADDVEQKKCKEVNVADVEAGVDCSVSQVIGGVTYRDHIPVIYGKLLQMLSETLGFTPSPHEYMQLIYDENRKIVDKAHGIAMGLGETGGMERMQICCQAYYPFLASIHEAAGRGGLEEDGSVIEKVKIPLIKQVGNEKLTNVLYSEEVLNLHADQLIRDFARQSELKKKRIESQTVHLRVDLSSISDEKRLQETIYSISLGKHASDGNANLLEMSSSDISRAIVALCDYSRYEDGVYAQTIDALGGLYFRLLFVPLPPMNTDPERSELLSVLKNIAPNSLMVDMGYLPFTENRNMNGASEFYQVKHSQYRFHRPPPLYTDIYKGNAGLYGLMMYTFAHKIQHSILHEANENKLSYAVAICRTIRHIIHPFYLQSKVGANPILKWQLIYYNGLLNICHGGQRTGYIDFDTENAEKTFVEKSSSGSDVQNRIPAYTDGSIKDGKYTHEGTEPLIKDNYTVIEHRRPVLDMILDSVTVESMGSIARVMEDPIFCHASTVFLNVITKYLACVVDELKADSNLMTLSEGADILKTIQMLIAFESLLHRQSQWEVGESLLLLSNEMLAFFVIKIREVSANKSPSDPELMVVPHGVKPKEEPCSGFAEIVDSLSMRLDGGAFSTTLEALVMAASSAGLANEIGEPLHTVLQVLYKRLPYMPDHALVGTVAVLLDAGVALQRAQEEPEEDPLGRSAQLVRILLLQCRQRLERQPSDTDELYRLSELGKNALVRALR